MTLGKNLGQEPYAVALYFSRRGKHCNHMEQSYGSPSRVRERLMDFPVYLYRHY